MPQFTLTGLMTCAECKGIVGGQLKKGKYVYYSCSGYKGCKRQYVPEATLLKQFYALLGRCTLTDKQIADITDALRNAEENKSIFYERSMKQLRAEHEKFEQRVRKMYEDKLDGRITDEMYDKLLHDYKSKQAELTEQMQEHDTADQHFYVTANMMLRLAKRAKQIFKSSQADEKRQLLSFLLANSELHAKNLTFTMRSPFNVVFSQTHHTTVRRERDSNPRLE
jgi:site-specific DNA recombinase